MGQLTAESDVCCCTVSTWTKAIGWVNIILSAVSTIIVTPPALTMIEMHLTQWTTMEDDDTTTSSADSQHHAHPALDIALMIFLISYLLLGIVAGTFLLTGAHQKIRCCITVWLIYAHVSVLVAIIGGMFRMAMRTGSNLSSPIVGIMAVIWNIFSIWIVRNFLEDMTSSSIHHNSLNFYPS